jgi:hypothetical protein
MNNNNYLDSLQTINGARIGDFGPQCLAQKHARKEMDSNEQNEQKETIRRLRIQNKKLQEQLVMLRKKLKQRDTEKTKIVEQIFATKKLNNSLSDALGSCSKCWGEDPDCPNCSGSGIPGWRKINSRLFNSFVLPALENFYGLRNK